MGLVAALEPAISVTHVIVSAILRRIAHGVMRPEVKLARRSPRPVSFVGHPVPPSPGGRPVRRRMRICPEEETGREGDQASSTAIDVGGLLALTESDSVEVSDAGASTNWVYFSWLEHHIRILERKGFPIVSTHAAPARLLSGNGPTGDVGHVADIPAGIAGNRVEFAAFALKADFPLFSHKGALEAMGGSRIS